MKNENKNEEVLQGQPLTESDLFYLEWGKETVKKNITLANEILKTIITLSTGLLGASIIFDKIVENEILRLFVLLSFFAALVISFLGVLPYEKVIKLSEPGNIKSHKRNALQHKRIYLWSSSFSIILGFSLIIAELIIKLLST